VTSLSADSRGQVVLGGLWSWLSIIPSSAYQIISYHIKLNRVYFTYAAKRITL